MENFNLQFLQSELNRISDWIKFADKKAGFLSAYYSLVFGLIIAQKTEISQHFAVYQKWITCFYAFVFLGTIISFGVGIFFLFKAIFPRLKNSFADKSLFYFGHIGKMEFIDYLDGIAKMTDEEAKKQIMEQIYTNSIIADQKMKNVQKSIKTFIVLTVFTILLILL